jgi:hypothetical protein
MPPSLGGWLLEGDLAWFISDRCGAFGLDTVEQLDLAQFYAVYRNDGWGAAAYDPMLMVAVLPYPPEADCQGMRSSGRSPGRRS